MIEKNGIKRRLSAIEIISYLTISIILNSLSNGLAVVPNLGSAVWTASAVNLQSQLQIGLGTILFIYAIIVQIINIVIIHKFNWQMTFSNLIFAFLFSYFVQIWTFFLFKLDINHWSFSWRLAIDVLGIFGIAIATSIYQRVDLMLHTNDELSYLIRFKLVHGSAAGGQYLSYIIPLLMIVYCYLHSGKLLSIGIGTIFALLFQGPLMGVADKFVFPHLKHRILLKNV